MQFMRYEGFSILSSWCYYQKFNFLKISLVKSSMAQKSSARHLCHGDKFT